MMPTFAWRSWMRVSSSVYTSGCDFTGLFLPSWRIKVRALAGASAGGSGGEAAGLRPRCGPGRARTHRRGPEAGAAAGAQGAAGLEIAAVGHELGAVSGR